MFLHEIDSELKELSFRFFYKFSRFEFSLKKNNFEKIEPRRGMNLASADWQKFREAYEKSYQPSEEVSKLLVKPPKAQVFDDRELIFVTEIYDDNVSDLRKVIISIHRIRNNLFHGGKHGCGTEGEIERNKYLLNNKKLNT